MGMVRANALISGRVQGVWFRGATQHMARGLGLTGWVRNLPLRKVEAVFEGPEDKVLEALEWCKQGPPTAAVSNLRVAWLDYTGEFEEFSIQR